MLYNKRLFILLIIIFNYFLYINVYAALFSDLEFGISMNYIQSSGLWNISFPTQLKDGTAVTGSSELDYNNMNNLSLSLLFKIRIAIINFELEFQPPFLSPSLSNGTGFDSDLFQIPGQNTTLFSKSSFQNQNAAIYINLKGMFDLTHFQLANKNLRLQGLFGYKKHIENITMTEGEQLLSNNSFFTDITVPPIGAKFDALQSTYEFNWNSLEAGLTIENEINKDLIIKIIPSLLYNFYTGEGFWNLRAYDSDPTEYAWRNESPNFMHYSASGFGFNLNLGLQYNLTSENIFCFNYQYIYQYASNGKETLYFYYNQYNYQSNAVTVNKIIFTKNIFSISLLNKF